MKNRQRNLDIVHHGLVLISDGNGRGRPSRLLLTKDQLSIEIPSDGATDGEVDTEAPNDQTRIIVIKRKGGGLGLSIKGGTENAQNLPIVISKIFPGMPADQTGQLYVGDAIVEVNGETVEGRSHDEVVEMLKAEGDELRLGVRHCSNIASFVKPSQSLQPGRSGGALDKIYEPNTWKSAMKAQSDLGLYNGKEKSVGLEGKDDKWKTITVIPLPMAYLTRYLWVLALEEEKEKHRTNSFEVRAVDGTSTGIIHCTDTRAFEQWISHINNHIQALNYKSIKMSNKYLHQSEQISYIGWVNEYMSEGLSNDPKQKWEPRFLILKGGDVCLFESPPLSSEDLNKCLYLYKNYDVAIKQVPNDSRRLDKRENCIYLETCMADGVHHYLSFETSQMLEVFENAYHKSVYTTVITMQTRTFACSFEGRPSGLVLDIKQGISLYDIPTKCYAWQYRFRDLHSSSDDGKVHVQLVFKDERSMDPAKLEVKEIECDEVLAVVYNIHSFLVTKIVASDPEFLKQNPLL
ncbi:PDZ/DHR/GLGF domain protein [Dictyocaulus viviparus]|uniref:PDZ/DHR/GLGF domain protein n=1 Tax=Dictyocaulus viviparus TaxID=29172 RepID=A0A0D8XHP7_DICVI|nr:PDZ/DHR/GLGF domain protein [Dictyocaulus viviparus]